MRDFLSARIAELGDRLWLAAERETEEGVTCLTGGPCSAGPAAHLTLVPTNDENRVLVRKSFVEAVAPAVFCDPDMRACYERLEFANGANRAKVATARRLLTIAFSLLRDGRSHERRGATPGGGENPSRLS